MVPGQGMGRAVRRLSAEQSGAETKSQVMDGGRVRSLPHRLNALLHDGSRKQANDNAEKEPDAIHLRFTRNRRLRCVTATVAGALTE